MNPLLASGVARLAVGLVRATSLQQLRISSVFQSAKEDRVPAMRSDRVEERASLADEWRRSALLQLLSMKTPPLLSLHVVRRAEERTSVARRRRAHRPAPDIRLATICCPSSPRSARTSRSPTSTRVTTASAIAARSCCRRCATPSPQSRTSSSIANRRRNGCATTGVANEPSARLAGLRRQPNDAVGLSRHRRESRGVVRSSRRPLNR